MKELIVVMADSGTSVSNSKTIVYYEPFSIIYSENPIKNPKTTVALAEVESCVISNYYGETMYNFTLKNGQRVICKEADKV